MFILVVLGCSFCCALCLIARRHTQVQNSPSPSPLRWLSFPLRRGDNVKAILFRAGEDSSPMVLLNTCVPTHNHSKLRSC